MLKTLLKRKGIRQLLIKTVLFIAIGIGASLFISVVFRNTQLFREYLTIPAQFTIEPPNSRTILLNSFLFGMIAFFIVSYKSLLNIKEFPFKKSQIAISISSFLFIILQYIYKYLISQNLDYFLQAPFFWGIIKISINLLFIITLGLGIYGIDFTRYFLKGYKKQILLFTAVSLGFFMLTLAFQNLWMLFSSMISEILYRFFSLFFDDVIYTPFVSSPSMSEGGGPLLGIKGFSALIGKPCSGIDSFLLFTSLYLLIILIDRKKLRPASSALFYIIGALGMFFTNMVRILLLYLVGAYISREFALGMFHTNIGWILFIIYFFVFFLLAKRFIYKKGPSA